MERVTHFLELPPEIIYNLPKVTLSGNVQLFVENHRGIIEYSRGKVRIAVNLGELAIWGDELVIGQITREGICLVGKIAGLQYHS